MHCVVAIPTFNRRASVIRAVETALAQAYDPLKVAVIDDGSTDDTRACLSRYFDDPRFLYIGLRHNVGTAQAKNAALALLPFDAITFHDSDDLSHPTKVLLQQRALALPAVMADHCLNWPLARREPGSRLDVGAALTCHFLIAPDGSKVRVGRALSLVDDFFPQLQMNAGPPGDWILINSGLFRRDVFQRLGGFRDCIEEDRELRNRLIMNGEVIWLIDEPLLTKIDSAGNLTGDHATGYASERRKADRAAIWSAIDDWRRGLPPAPVPIDVREIVIDFVSRPDEIVLARDIPLVSPGIVDRSEKADLEWTI
ncbi:MAG: glycosyltransferase family 2 protein [Beijerinckiaceae bacterium]|nr:glycosyltransferase family 2 protein [Beijerinckiaceae bacterium]